MKIVRLGDLGEHQSPIIVVPLPEPRREPSPAPAPTSPEKVPA